MVTTASTGDGVPELLAALDRHRANGRDEPDDAARRTRAEAQVRAIVDERVASRLRSAQLAALTEATTLAVAEHRLDPYSAADRLVAALAGDGADG